LAGCKLVEPYAGSAAVTLALVSEGICSEALIVERDPLMYSFWQVAFSNPEALIKKIQEADVSLKTWHELRVLLDCEQPDDGSIVEMAFAALFFNRTNFSGVLHTGPIGGQEQSSDYKIDCRFNRTDLVSKIESLAGLREKIEVRFGDAIDIIKENKRRVAPFFYIDPPYFVQGRKLYRHHYKLRDHVALSKALISAKFKWMLSYDNHEVIQSLYSDFTQVEKSFQYSTRVSKSENELLITNLDVPLEWRAQQLELV
jgi:DNA adenine methylase